MVFFRYPGGKSKVKNIILSKIITYYNKNKCYDNCQYVEPFFGGGSIGLNFIQNTEIKNIMIADKDPGICCLWNAILLEPNELCHLIENFKPSIDNFFAMKDFLLSEQYMNNDKNNPLGDFVKIGFYKIALHQISYSGLGTMAGGPLGGVKQNSKYKIDCRWNSANLIKKIRKVNQTLSSVKIYRNKCLCIDFSTSLNLQKEKREWEQLGFKNTVKIEKFQNRFFYLDPPYFEKGNQLYQYSFNVDQHQQLSNILRRLPFPWLLSYDCNQEIKQMYSWASFVEIPLKYTINAKDKAVCKKELLICNPDIDYIFEQEEDIFNI